MLAVHGGAYVYSAMFSKYYFTDTSPAVIVILPVK